MGGGGRTWVSICQGCGEWDDDRGWVLVVSMSWGL